MYEDVILTTKIKRDDWGVIGESLEHYLAHDVSLCKVIPDRVGDVEVRAWVYSVDLAKVVKEVIGLCKAAGLKSAPSFKTKTQKWTF